MLEKSSLKSRKSVFGPDVALFALDTVTVINSNALIAGATIPTTDGTRDKMAVAIAL